MADGDFARSADELEFHPATQEQIDRIGSLTGQLLDGTVALASRRHMFAAEYFESEFFHQWLARYVHEGAVIEVVDVEEADELLRDPDQRVAAFPEKIRHNQVGMALGMASGITYDGGGLECSIPITGSTISYDLTLDSEIVESGGLPELTGLSMRDANEEQARAILGIARLVARLDETGSPAPAERAASMGIRERFKDFPRDGYDEGGASEETVAALKTLLLGVVDQRSIRATFLRRFSGAAGKTNLVAEVVMDREGRYSRRYDLQIRVPAAIDEFDHYVTKLVWGDGTDMDLSRYLDVDMNALIGRKEAEDPDFDFGRSGMTLLNAAMSRRRRQQQIFEEERNQGFHMFSQADANGIIGTLQAPGQEIMD